MAELNIGDAEVKSLQAEIMAKFHATALNMHARYRQSTPHPRSQTASKETSSSYVSTASLLPDEGDDSPCILQMWTDVHIFSLLHFSRPLSNLRLNDQSTDNVAYLRIFRNDHGLCNCNI